MYDSARPAAHLASSLQPCHCQGIGAQEEDGKGIYLEHGDYEGSLLDDLHHLRQQVCARS